MKRWLTILSLALPAVAADVLTPPGFKPPARSPKLAEQTAVSRMVKASPSSWSPVELRLSGWYSFNGQRVPQPELLFRTNAPKATIFSWVNGGWNCWTVETNVRAGETRRVGWCPNGIADAQLWKVVLHD